MVMVTREADVAELALIQIGEGPHGPFVLSPFLERRMQCQQAIDCQQDDVIVSQ